MWVTTITGGLKSIFKCLFKRLDRTETVFLNYMEYQRGNKTLIRLLTSEQMVQGGISYGIFFLQSWAK